MNVPQKQGKLFMDNLGEDFRSLIFYFAAIDDRRKSTNAETWRENRPIC